MSIEVWLAFVIASAILLLIPGPTILTVISYSVSYGYKAKIPLIMAVAVGDATALALSFFGLGVLLAESAFWFQIVKGIGGLYLIILGLKLIFADTKMSSVDRCEEDFSSWKLFFNTYLVTALNPKGIVFFVAFLPQFINTNAGSTTQAWILSFTFVALAAINTALYSVYASKARSVVSSVKAQRRFNVSGGSLLCIAGLWALSAKRS